MKKCTLCKEDKNLDEFYTNHARCKKCHIKKTREYIIANPDIRKKSLDNWREKYNKSQCVICGNDFYKNSISKECSSKCRILNKIDKKENGCWEWKGKIRKNGYGEIRVNQKYVLVHRLSYEVFKGKFEGLVLHKCDNPKCCNPDHLIVGTQSDNIRDSIRKGRFNRKRNCKGEFI